MQHLVRLRIRFSKSAKSRLLWTAQPAPFTTQIVFEPPRFCCSSCCGPRQSTKSNRTNSFHLAGTGLPLVVPWSRRFSSELKTLLRSSWTSNTLYRIYWPKARWEFEFLGTCNERPPITPKRNQWRLCWPIWLRQRDDGFLLRRLSRGYVVYIFFRRLRRQVTLFCWFLLTQQWVWSPLSWESEYGVPFLARFKKTH